MAPPINYSTKEVEPTRDQEGQYDVKPDDLADAKPSKS